MTVGSIDYAIDRSLWRVVIRFIGDVDGPQMLAAMTRLWQESPVVANCDTICGIREFTGDIGFDDIRAVSEAWQLFCGSRDFGQRTAIVSHDRFAPLLVQAIALRFRGRELATFRAINDAVAWLDRTT